MKRVWFTFKIFESILGLSCMGYHARGFLNIDYIQDHYTYVTVFGGFSLMAMFGCLSICLKEPVSAFREGSLNIFAAIAFIMVSINSMYHAEKDFHLMYLSVEKEEAVEKHLQEVELTEQPHPFFKYSKAQSVAALCCGSLFLLHAILAFDLAMVNSGRSLEEIDEDEESIQDENDGEQLIFYVFGKKVHEWLNQYEWFITLADIPTVNKEELIEVNLPTNVN